jgi:hypothetical protein
MSDAYILGEAQDQVSDVSFDVLNRRMISLPDSNAKAYDYNILRFDAATISNIGSLVDDRNTFYVP